jgi:hypothetical protein
MDRRAFIKGAGVGSFGAGAFRRKQPVLLSWALGLGVMLSLSALAVVPATASDGVNITGGGMTNGMTRFALAIHDGNGHFECLMPGLMTVEATVMSATATGGTASLKGVATVTLAKGNPFGLPAGPMAVGVPFTASAVAGGPGVGQEDLKILGMDFPGTVEHGQISIGN